MARKRVNVAGAAAIALFGMFCFCCGGPCALLMQSDRQPQTNQSNYAANNNATRTTPSASSSSLKPSPSSTSSPLPNSAPPAVSPIAQPVSPVKPIELPSAVPAPVVSKRPEPEAESGISSASVSVREWTSSDGRYKTSARFIELADGQVKLQKSSGDISNVPLGKLSVIDHEYLKDLLLVDRQEPKPQVLLGSVTSVTSGDTFLLSDPEKHQFKIRLQGITSPSLSQTHSTLAKQALSKKVLGKFVWVETRDVNEKGETSGYVYLAGQCINVELVAEGNARHNTSLELPKLANAELIARHRKIGIWSNGNGD